MSLQLAIRGVLWLLLGLLVVLSNWGPTKRREGKPTGKISWAFILAVAVGLACISLLHNTDSTRLFTEWGLVGQAVIPACVVFSSVFAVSFWEPLIMPWVLYLVPRVLGFMPVSREFKPLEYLVATAILSLLTSALGCLALYLSRRLRSGRWSWDLVRGLAWGMPFAAGTMFAFRSKVSTDIAFRNDYTLVWILLAEVVLVTGIAGLRRTKPIERQDRPRESPTVCEPPDQGVLQDTSRRGTPEPAPASWRSIRSFPDLFPVGRKINYPAGVAFAVAAFLIVSLQNIVQLDGSSIGRTLPPRLLGGLVRALLEGLLFVMVGRWIRQVWMLPVVWGVLSEATGIVTRVLLGGSLELMSGVSLYAIVAGALFMAGLVLAVQAWGPGLGSWLTGSVLFAVPLWIYGSIVSMPGRVFVMLLVSRIIFAVLLYAGMRHYFGGPKPQATEAGP